MIDDFENKSETGFRFRKVTRCPRCLVAPDQYGVMVHDPQCPVRRAQRLTPRPKIRRWDRTKECK